MRDLEQMGKVGVCVVEVEERGVMRCRGGKSKLRKGKEGWRGAKLAGETQERKRRGEKITKYEIERGDRRPASELHTNGRRE